MMSLLKCELLGFFYNQNQPVRGGRDSNLCMTSPSNIGDEHLIPQRGLLDMIYVISKAGKPLMSTERYGKVRRFLKRGFAKVVKRGMWYQEKTQPVM